MLLYKAFLTSLALTIGLCQVRDDGVSLPRAEPLGEEWHDALRRLCGLFNVVEGPDSSNRSMLSASFSYKQEEGDGAVGPQFQWRTTAFFVGGYLMVKGSTNFADLAKSCNWIEGTSNSHDCVEHSAEVLAATLIAAAIGTADAGQIGTALTQGLNSVRSMWSGSAGQLRKRIPCNDNREDIAD